MEVSASQLPTPKPRRGTLEVSHPLPTYTYGALTLYGRPFQATSASLERGLTADPRNTTSIQGFPRMFGLSSSPFGRPYSGNPILVSFPPPTEMLHFGGFPLPEGAPRIGFRGRIPIRASPDLRLHAPTRGLSQLATPFFGARAELSTRQLSVSGLGGWFILATATLHGVIANLLKSLLASSSPKNVFRGLHQAKVLFGVKF